MPKLNSILIPILNRTYYQIAIYDFYFRVMEPGFQFQLFNFDLSKENDLFIGSGGMYIYLGGREKQFRDSKKL